jgi:PAS domain S-box-containing protein
MKSEFSRRARYRRLPVLMLLLTVAILVALGSALIDRPPAAGVAALIVAPLLASMWACILALRRELIRVTESRAHLAASVRSFDAAVFTTDPAGKIVSMNRGAEEISGMTEENAQGHALVEVLKLCDAATKAPVDPGLAQALASRKNVKLPRNIVAQARDGTERIVEGAAVLIEVAGHAPSGAVLVLRDITEQTLAESALRASQELFHRITENVSDTISVHELDGARVFQSRTSEFFPTQADGPDPKDPFSHIVGEDREAVIAAFDRVVRTGQPQRIEYRVHCTGQAPIVAESVGTLIRDIHGSPEKVLVVSRNITEQIEARERLRREKEFSESVLKGLPGVFFVCDASRHILRWNRNFEIVTGYSAEELARTDLLQIFPLEERARIEARLHRCFSDGKADIETHVRHRNGRSTAYYITGLRSEENAQPTVLGIGIDIHARRLAEESVRATSRRLERQIQALSEQARNPALRGDDLGLAYRTITEVASQTLGVSRASIWFYDGGRNAILCADLYDHPRGIHETGAEINRADCPRYFDALEEGRVIPAHYARNDPRTRDFAESYLKPLGITSMLDAPIRSEGRLIGVICHEHTGSPREWTLDEQSFAGSMADLVALSLEVSQRREAQSALVRANEQLEWKVAERTRELSQANERLQELDRLKSEFLATMSHELRTPLNSIIGFTGILRQQLAGPLNDEQQKQLGMVHFSARHLLALINDLLDLSRIESGKMEVHLEPTPIAEVVHEVAESLRPTIDRKKLTFETRVPPGLSAVPTDRKKLFQILLNLANNAVKFTEEGGVTIDVRTMPEFFCFYVIDTGIGIKPDQFANLFQAFRQVDGSARRVFEGTGLGLYLCKKLVTLLGGSIGVESEFGAGSRFFFTIPRKAFHSLQPPHSPS